MRAFHARFEKVIFAVTLLGLVALLFFAIRTLLRDTLVYLARVLKLLYLTIPEGMIWAAFLGGVALLALYTLRRSSQASSLGRFAPPRHADRRVTQVAKWFMQPHSAYYQGRINFALANIAAGIFALRGRASEQQIKNELRLGHLDLPEEVEIYLQNGLKRWPELVEGEPGSLAGLVRRSLPEKVQPGGAQGKRRENFERVMKFLEEELEIEHGD